MMVQFFCGHRLSWCSVLVLLSFTNVLFAADSPAPATVEQAIKVFDLRTAALPESAVAAEARQVGSVTYEIKKDPKAAFQAQRDHLVKQGWKELPGSMVEAAYGSGMFEKSTFVVTVSTSESGEAGKSQVSVINFGNLRPSSLPVVKGAKSTFANEATAMYFTDSKASDVVEATRKLLVDAGWEPYGSAGSLPDFVSMSFKRNAIQIQANVGESPAQQGKTSIMYSTLQLSADIPAPSTADDVRYVDMMKTLRFTSSDDYDAVGQFYQKSLAKLGWKPTSEALIKSNDQFKRPIASQVYRNSAKDILTLDMTTQDEKTHAVVKHLTADEFALIEKKAREAAEKLVAEREANKKKAPMPTTEELDVNAIIKDALKSPTDKGNTVGIPIPANAKKVDRTGDNVLQIKLAAGKGQAGAKYIRDQLVAAKWKLEDEPDLDESSGNLIFKKGTQQITLTYVDTGLTDVMMMVIGIGAKLEQAKGNPDVKADTPATPRKPTVQSAPDEPLPIRNPDPNPQAEKPKKGISNLEKLANSGTLKMGDKMYRLANVVAYRSKSGDEFVTIVLLTEKPINLEKLKASLKKDGTDDGLFEFQAQVRLQIDANDKVQSMSLWADNASISGNSDLEGEVLVEDGRVRGTAKLAKPGEFFKKTYTFDVSFDAEVLATSARK